MSGVRGKFWKQFAEKHSYSYEEKGQHEGENALLFKEGHSRAMEHVVSGEISGRKFRLFEYEFTTGRGKHARTYNYAVFEVPFEGHFPHIYLDQHHNNYGIGCKGEKLPIPHEFQKQFTLYGPLKYEMEALMIFTPELFAYLLDEKWPHDVELVDQELLIFRRDVFYNLKDLEAEFDRAFNLAKMIATKLDRAKFLPIGDMPHRLQSVARK